MRRVCVFSEERDGQEKMIQIQTTDTVPVCGESEVEIRFYEGEGYKPMVSFEGWKVAYLRYEDRFDPDKADRMERHLLTDEVFVLLEGEAFLLIGEDDKMCPMEKNKIYNVRKAVWHTICVSRDALVLIVENMNTAASNTERRPLSPTWKKQLG